MTGGSMRMGGGPLHGEDESNRKRQVRLLKNREAAKECRRKKKVIFWSGNLEGKKLFFG